MSEDSRTELAWQRTAWALERTQLAWIRTTFSMMTTGFVLDKGAAALHQARLLQGESVIEGSHVVGVCLTLLATIQLCFATARYCGRERRLAVSYGYPPPRVPAGLPVSLLVIVLGIVVAGVLIWTG